MGNKISFFLDNINIGCCKRIKQLKHLEDRFLKHKVKNGLLGFVWDFLLELH